MDSTGNILTMFQTRPELLSRDTVGFSTMIIVTGENGLSQAEEKTLCFVSLSGCGLSKGAVGSLKNGDATHMKNKLGCQ